MEDKKVLLSVKNLNVKFRVRGRILTAIRGISLDIYENESIAIVGESGSGKSVFTKTFAGMLDSNGFIDQGDIIFNDPELADTKVKLTPGARQLMKGTLSRLNAISKYELGAATYRRMMELKAERERAATLSDEERAQSEEELAKLRHERTQLFNERQTYDPRKERRRIREASRKIKEYDAQIKACQKRQEDAIKRHQQAVKNDTAATARYEQEMAELKAQYEREISGEISEETRARNEILGKEIRLSVGRYSLIKRVKLTHKLLVALKKAMQLGVDLNDEEERNKVFATVAFRVRFLDETVMSRSRRKELIREHHKAMKRAVKLGVNLNDEAQRNEYFKGMEYPVTNTLHGTCVLNLAQVKYNQDWMQIRGRRIATVFQDPMTSLNPIITIGKQITSIIIKHQGCSEVEARRRALELMHKVGIPKAEQRFDDYPFQYSGGMRQRIVIAIALSCQPKILICDEPTTALDVTIQAQILQLIKDLQKEFNFTTVFITHDLGVVANIADRVAVLYAGQLVEVGTVEDVFYDPRHPYTWALLSSLPQLAQRNTQLYSITGTPPSLYNAIVGDAFAPRNPYCLKIDTIKEPPMFKVSDTHYAKTWLLDPRAPKIDKPEGIHDIHQKLMAAFNI